MSCYETHRAILKEVDLEGKSLEQYLSELVPSHKYEIDVDDPYWIDEFIYDNSLDDKYIYANEHLYEIIKHERKFDEEDDFCDVVPNKDGTLSVHAQFYNGGVCFNEMLDYALKERDKIN